MAYRKLRDLCPFTASELRQLYHRFGTAVEVARQTGFEKWEIYHWMRLLGIARGPRGSRKKPKPEPSETREVSLVYLQQTAPEKFEKAVNAILAGELTYVGAFSERRMMSKRRLSYLQEALEGHARDLTQIAGEIGPENGRPLVEAAVENLKDVKARIEEYLQHNGPGDARASP